METESKKQNQQQTQVFKVITPAVNAPCAASHVPTNMHDPLRSGSSVSSSWMRGPSNKFHAAQKPSCSRTNVSSNHAVDNDTQRSKRRSFKSGARRRRSKHKLAEVQCLPFRFNLSPSVICVVAGRAAAGSAVMDGSSNNGIVSFLRGFLAARRW